MQSIFFDKHEVRFPDTILSLSGAHRVNPMTFMTPYGLMWSPHSLFMSFHNEVNKAQGSKEELKYLGAVFGRHEGLKGIIIRDVDRWVETFFVYEEKLYLESSLLSPAGGVISKMMTFDQAVTDAYNALYGEQELDVMMKAVKEQTMLAHCSYSTFTKSHVKLVYDKLSIKGLPF